jgi:ankyrin repeat protein
MNNGEELIYTTRRGNIHQAKQLLADGANVNYTDHAGWTPCHWVLCANHLNIIDMVKLFIVTGANVNKVTNSGLTLCHAASYNGHFVALKLLVASGADVNITNNCGDTSFHMAARHGKLDCLKVLVSLGASIDCRNKPGQTPRDEANYYGHNEVVAYLDTLVTAIDNVRYIVCLLIGIQKRGCRCAPLNPLLDSKGIKSEGVSFPLPQEGMGNLLCFPKEIVLMIAKWVWATRRDEEWQEGVLKDGSNKTL